MLLVKQVWNNSDYFIAKVFYYSLIYSVMKSWTIDAREAINDLDKIEDIDYDLIEQTELIKDFFEEDHYRFIIATKGLGKSLLLLSKRKLFKDTYLIPEHLPLDVPSVNLYGLSKESQARLSNRDYFSLLWSLSIVIAISKKLSLVSQENDYVSNSLINILHSDKYDTISDVFGLLINDIDSKQLFEDLMPDYNKTLLPLIRGIKKTIVAFIDNVDECFESHGDISRAIWYEAQISLMKSVYDLCRINNKVKIFVSIRKEAFMKHNSEMIMQYKSVSLDLEYSKVELKDIFENNIKKDNPAHFIKKDSDPIAAFVGTDFVKHGLVEECEKIFDYIYRHTLRRPRDLMEIGGAISRCKTIERDPSTISGLQKFKIIVNNSGTNIAKQYLLEVLPHLSITAIDLERLYPLIDSNVLNDKKLKIICMEFNGNNANCLLTDCKKCFGKIHIFCELYKVGLLGYVEKNPTEKNQYMQIFERVGEKTFYDIRLLPKSSSYLIHPILDGLLRDKNDTYKNNIHVKNIIGYDRPWLDDDNDYHENEHKVNIDKDEIKVEKKISILFVAADPSTEARLRLNEEFREIQEKISQGKFRESLKLEIPQLSARPSDISQALLNANPNILHISGHGATDGSICFEDNYGHTQLVSPEALGALFKKFSKNLKCVLLNACYSKYQATAISKHISFVVGMKKAIGDNAAIAFTKGFYQAIGAGRNIFDAYEFGLVQIMLNGISGHNIPVLYKNGKIIIRN